ncbi:MAG: type II secretion system protein [Casimicrobiaceae bacterium]
MAMARARGFSLLEVLVAFVILSLVATALFRLFSGALGNASAAAEYSRAVLVAQSAISEASVALREGTQSGTAEGDVQWKVDIAPYEVPGLNPDLMQASASLPLRMFRIVATVRFPAPTGGERTITLSTLRIGARETL